MAAKLRRTPDVRLVTASVFGPRFFCGQYVLADCTDETSAEILAAIVKLDSHQVHSVIERLLFGVGFCFCSAESTKVQCGLPCSIVVLSLERFRGVVRQQLLHCLRDGVRSLNCQCDPDVASVLDGIVIGVVVSAEVTLAQIVFLLRRQL